MAKIGGRNTSTITSPPKDYIGTRADFGAPTTWSEPSEQERGRRWERLVYDKLDSWRRDPTQLEDDNLDPPSIHAIRLAANLAARLQAEGNPPPTFLVPDPNGGIVFEYRNDNTTDLLHVWSDGKIEHIELRDNHVVLRSPFLDF
jgi:hypothetical protein